MSIVGMRKNMQSWFRPMMLLLAVALAISIVLMMAGGGQFQQDQGNNRGVLAKVNKQKIDWKSFELRYEAKVDEASQDRQISAFEKSQMRGQMFDQEVDQVLLIQAAKKERVKISRSELGKKISKIVDDELKREKGEMSDKAFNALLERNGLNQNKLKTEIRKRLDVNALRRQLLSQKLVEKLKKQCEGKR